MIDIESDILSVLKRIAATPDLVRQVKVKNKNETKHSQQLKERINTQVELLSAELERVLPRDSPLFMQVLMGAMIRKLGRMEMEQDNREPEYKSALDHFPPGF